MPSPPIANNDNRRPEITTNDYITATNETFFRELFMAPTLFAIVVQWKTFVDCILISSTHVAFLFESFRVGNLLSVIWYSMNQLCCVFCDFRFVPRWTEYLLKVRNVYFVVITFVPILNQSVHSKTPKTHSTWKTFVTDRCSGENNNKLWNQIHFGWISQSLELFIKQLFNIFCKLLDSLETGRATLIRNRWNGKHISNFWRTDKVSSLQVNHRWKLIYSN